MVRKLIIGGIGFLLSIMGDGASGVGLATTVPHGEVHVVDTSRLNWMSIARNVFDRLIELDADGKMVPGLATAWRWVDDHTLEITLRQGVTFQNGEGFDAAALKRNWDAYTRLGQPHILGEFLSFKPGSRLEIIGPYTVRFHFPELDGTVLVKLSNLHIASPEFHAVQGWGEQQWGILTSAGPWGSGPYKLVDGFSTPGGRVKRLVLEANAHYWDATRLPRLQRIIFDNTLNHKEALEIIRSKDGLVDLISELRPGETFGLAQSPLPGW